MDIVKWWGVASYKSGPPLCVRARDLLDEVLAEKVWVKFLVTTRARPFAFICIVLPISWPVVQKEPCLLDRDLLTMKGGGPALARIIKDSHHFVSVCRECL